MRERGERERKGLGVGASKGCQQKKKGFILIIVIY